MNNDNLEDLLNGLRNISELVALELISQYSDIENKLIDNKQKNIEECIMIYQEILHDIDICLRQEISIDQRMLLIEKEIEISKALKDLIIETKKI